MSFPCTNCGMCCMRAGQVVESARALISRGAFDNNPYVQEIAAFPYGYAEGGRCEMLADDNTCKVYDHRPDICSIEKTWKKYHSGEMPLEEYYSQTIVVCNELITDGGIDKKYLINEEGR